MLQAKLKAFKNSNGIDLPEKVSVKLQIKKDHEEFIQQMDIAGKIMHDEHDVLKILAKS